MASASDARKKAKERRQLEQFKESFEGFPISDILEGENPDFLVRTEERCVGIEITELHREAFKDATETLRAQSARKEAVLRKAKLLCEDMGLDLFHVYVNFHPGCEVSRERQQDLERELAQSIQRYLPGHGKSVEVRHSPKTPLSDEITFISIDQVPFDREDTSYIVYGSSGTYDSYDIEDVQKVLGRKKARVEDYKKQCREVWLLVICGQSMYSSTWVELGFEAKTHIFNSQFDRAFYLHLYRGEVVELTLNKP